MIHPAVFKKHHGLNLFFPYTPFLYKDQQKGGRKRWEKGGRGRGGNVEKSSKAAAAAEAVAAAEIKEEAEVASKTAAAVPVDAATENVVTTAAENYQKPSV